MARNATGIIMKQLPSKRCFLCDLATGKFVANSRETVRLLAIVTNIQPIVDRVQYPGDSETQKLLDYHTLLQMTLDDGTAMADIYSPDYMIQKLNIQPGETVECIAWLRQRGDKKKWYLKCLARVTDPHAEILRWMELSAPKDACMEHGFPKFKQNAERALRLIALHAHDGGVSLQDMALVMQIPIHTAQKMVEELQLAGDVYQSSDGNYVPV